MKFGLFTKKEEQRDNHIVIPSHSKKSSEGKNASSTEEMIENVVEGKPFLGEQKEITACIEPHTARSTLQSAKYKNLFRVTGLYDVGGLVMISGIVESGRIAKKMKAKKDDKEMEIKEIRINSDKVQQLLSNEQGTLFVKAKQMPFVRYDDLLAFK